MKYDYDHYDILSTLSKYADYKQEGLDSVRNTVYKIMWKKLYDENECKDYAEGMEEIYDINFSEDLSKMYISKDVPKSVFDEKKSLKEEKVTDSLFSDIVFSMIKKFKLKKEYDVERPSWSVFNFRHKNKDAQFAITFDKRGHGDFLYGDVLAFGDEKDDIFKYKTDEVKIDSYNIEKECLNIIADCLAFIDTNKKITIFESKKFTKSLIEGISAFNKAIAKKYNETEPNGAGQYYLDWRFDLHDEKDNIEAIADRCGVTVEFQTDEGYFEVFEESKKSARKSLKESVEFDYDNHSGVFFAYVDGSDLSIAYAPRKYEDLSGWDISKDGVPIVYDVWEDKSDEYVFNSIKEFEKQLKKYFDIADVKIIMKDFHEKVGKYI